MCPSLCLSVCGVATSSVSLSFSLALNSTQKTPLSRDVLCAPCGCRHVVLCSGISPHQGKSVWVKIQEEDVHLESRRVLSIVYKVCIKTQDKRGCISKVKDEYA